MPRRGAGGSPLAEVARVFLKLGTIAFGGPAAHIAMMDDEVVRRRAWVSREEFLDLVGAAHLVPGPNSTELAIHLGYRRAGAPGLIVAGAAFILPAAAITLALAWLYVRTGSLPAAEGVLHGVKPVVIAVVAQALVQLARTAVKSGRLAALGGVAAAASVAGVHEVAVLAGAAALGMLLRPAGGGRATASALALATAPGLGLTSAAAAGAPAGAALAPLFLVFAKIGAVLFGSGYVLLAFLRADLVERRGWLTEGQLMDAVAAGQVTPGPVFTTATFIGYLLRGPAGAAVATAGIFLPAFVFVALSGPLVPRLRRSPAAARVLDGVNVASLALMAVVSVQLARAALVDATTVALAAASFVLLLRWRVNAAWLVLGGALAGLAAGVPARAAAKEAAVGAIEGRVVFTGTPPPPTIVFEGGGTQPVLHLGPERGLRYAVVFLPEAPPAPGAVPGASTVEQSGFTFQPQALAVREGQAVRFTNEDGANHNVRCAHADPANRLDVYTGAGQAHTHRFRADPGAVPVAVTCQIHPWMASWIYVFAHPHFAVTGADGRFSIPGVAPGAHRLAVRHAAGRLSRDLRVRVEAGRTAHVEVAFDRLP